VFFQAEDGIRDRNVTGVQTCALPISLHVPALVRLQGVQHALHGEEHLPAVVAKVVQGAALYQAFNGTAVQLPAGHALAEVVERRSEERRVGKEWSSGWWQDHTTKRSQ